jgi:biotin operon repressor
MPSLTQQEDVVIDRIRKDLEDRLEQLLTEVDKLRRALLALGPRGKPAPAPEAASKPRTPARARTRSQSSTASRSRSAPGATKQAVLGTLADGAALTAGEIAAATGISRPTVSTTLSRLAKSGEVVKAERGYRLSAATD